MKHSLLSVIALFFSFSSFAYVMTDVTAISGYVPRENSFSLECTISDVGEVSLKRETAGLPGHTYTWRIYNWEVKKLKKLIFETKGGAMDSKPYSCDVGTFVVAVRDQNSDPEREVIGFHDCGQQTINTAPATKKLSKFVLKICGMSKYSREYN